MQIHNFFPLFCEKLIRSSPENTSRGGISKFLLKTQCTSSGLPIPSIKGVSRKFHLLQYECCKTFHFFLLVTLLKIIKFLETLYIDGIGNPDQVHYVSIKILEIPLL